MGRGQAARIVGRYTNLRFCWLLWNGPGSPRGPAGAGCGFDCVQIDAHGPVKAGGEDQIDIEHNRVSRWIPVRVTDGALAVRQRRRGPDRSEEHTSELQSLRHL